MHNEPLVPLGRFAADALPRQGRELAGQRRLDSQIFQAPGAYSDSQAKADNVITYPKADPRT